jgi:hypothetical protein
LHSKTEASLDLYGFSSPHNVLLTADAGTTYMQTGSAKIADFELKREDRAGLSCLLSSIKHGTGGTTFARVLSQTRRMGEGPSGRVFVRDPDVGDGNKALPVPSGCGCDDPAPHSQNVCHRILIMRSLLAVTTSLSTSEEVIQRPKS